MWAGKRGVLEIIAGILQALAEDRLRKTHLSYKTNLDSRATSKYIDLMVKLELIGKSHDDPSFFIITRKGQYFLDRYQELIKIVDLVS